MASAFNAYLTQLDQFIAREQALTEDISHELRTPLAVTRSSLTLLLESTDLSPLTRQRIERMDRATRQMHELTEAVLFLAREDGGGGIAPVPLHELLMDVLESRNEAALRSHTALHLGVITQQTVIAHPGMVKSIIGNVLDNAIRHGGAGRVTLTLAPGALTITDQGSGIPADRLSVLFDRKTRGDGSRGYGLGLHIVRNLCERLGWTITLSNRPEGGVTAAIHFPIQQSTIR